MKKELNSPVIWQSKGIRNGQPLVKDSRVPVSEVLDHLALGWSVTQITELFPTIKKRYLKKLLENISKEYKKS